MSPLQPAEIGHQVGRARLPELVPVVAERLRGRVDDGHGGLPRRSSQGGGRGGSARARSPPARRPGKGRARRSCAPRDPRAPPRGGRAGVGERRHERRQQRGALRPVGPEHRDGAVEEADLAQQVATAARHPSRGLEPPAGPRRELGGRARADLLLVAAGGLEMEADPGVGLGQVAPSPRATTRAARAAAPARTSPARRRRPRARGRGGSAAAALDPDQQVAPHEAVAGLLELGARDPAGQRVHRAGLERVARDRAERERGALGGVEPVEARREQRVQRGREPVRGRVLLVGVGDELLEEQRVAARRLGDPLLDVRLQPTARDRLEQRRARRGRERAQLEHALAPEAGAPTRGGARAGRAGRPSDQHAARRAAVPRRRGAGPAAQARPGGHRRSPRSAAATGRARRSAAGRPSRCPPRPGPPRVPSPRRPAARPRAEAEPGRELVDRAVAHRLQDDLAQRPVRRALAVGGAAAGQQPRRRRDRASSAARCDLPMPGSPTIASGSGAPVAATRANVARSRATSSLAADQRPVELSPDRRGIGVDAGQQEAAVGQPDARAPWRTGARSTRRSGSRRRGPSARAARPQRRPRRSPAPAAAGHDLAGADAAAGPHAERQALASSTSSAAARSARCGRPRARRACRTPPARRRCAAPPRRRRERAQIARAVSW